LRATVLGAVLSPGVYPLAEGARVRNLIEAAGGAQANADLSRLGVTAALRDGQTVYVPQVGETPPLLVGGKLNLNVALNVATALQLHDALGISSTEGKRIVSYREKHGRYSAVSDLLLVRHVTDQQADDLAHADAR
jgi:competence protein ComEA